jgi:Cu-Zn family superoxide dismutase
MKKTLSFVMLSCALVLIVACAKQEPAPEEEASNAPAEPISRLDTVLQAKSGSEMTGIAMFIQDDYGVTLQLNIENTTPGEHAVHLHEVGDCSADDASSAGGHWNPTHEEHGKWGVPPHHLGDIGNITVGEDGTGSLTLTTDRWTLGDGGESDIYGKSIIVHEGPDDFSSQPSGAAGARIGCAVIEIKK